GYAAGNDDCDDSDATVSPEAPEVCDGLDNDCDGTADGESAEGVLSFYADGDGDGYGDAASTTEACSVPSGYSADATDCDDSDGAVSPGADETCDGIDNDCDPSREDAPDGDADGFDVCSECDDGDPDIHPAQPEIACDGADNDCDSVADEDFDADGDLAYDAGPCNFGTDCDDQNSDINPSATEVCNLQDDNCNGTIDEGF
ncbi:MAG: putative metal-binding motif-containing protein, partial [Planctomycetota bacterium]|nr:putative metal-binding motif-containing protein [Planctomycetota bacterium]